MAKPFYPRRKLTTPSVSRFIAQSSSSVLLDHLTTQNWTYHLEICERTDSVQDVLTVLGLVLNTLGALIILIPDIPKLYRFAHRFRPLKTIEKGEKQLYHENELRPEHTGFKRIAEAYFSGSPPLSDAPRLDNVDSNSAMVRIGETELKADDGGFVVKRFLRDEGETIYDCTYTVELYSEPLLEIQNHLAEFGVPTPNPSISMQSSQGASPDYIEKYKRRVLFRIGAILLLIGFILQLIGQFNPPFLY